MTSFDKEIIQRNENWIKLSNKEIERLMVLVDAKLKCIHDLRKQNRILKGREKDEL